MFAANIWHWWLGVLLALGSAAAVLTLVAGYLKSVTSQRYPGKRFRAED
jgi:hypothetical protein